MRILANSEDPDEMPHNAAFHQDLHYLLRQKRYSEKEMKVSSHTMDHLKLIVSSQKNECMSVNYDFKCTLIMELGDCSTHYE